MLELRGITKAYPGVLALDNVSLAFNRGEVHAIAGENGAGKSTLIKVLSGAIRPDAGSVALDGRMLGPINPHDAIRLGISTIYQEFNLVPFLSVAENIFFGLEPRRFGLLDKKRMHRMASGLCEEMGVDLDTHSRVKDLGVAYQQIVEILKAVSRDARILIMDEPTAPLTTREIDVLFGIVERVRRKAVTIIYISHRLEEIFRICDRVSVLRDGRRVVTTETKATNEQELVSFMVGRKLDDVYPARNSRPGAEALRIQDLRNRNLRGVSFVLREREILGIGGLVGAGRTELARAVFGADALVSGQMYLAGKAVQIRKPRDAIRRGIGLLPEDRKQHGLLLGMSVKQQHLVPHPQSALAVRTCCGDSASTGSVSTFPDASTSKPPRWTSEPRISAAATSKRWCSRSGSAPVAEFSSSTSRRGGSTSGPSRRSTFSSTSLSRRGRASS